MIVVMMQHINALNVLLRRIPASIRIDRLRTHQAGKADLQFLFQQYAHAELPGFTYEEWDCQFQLLLDEARQMIQSMRSSIAQRNIVCTPSDEELVFYTVLRLAKEFISMDGEQPVCRIEHLSAWRKAYLSLGQDLFVCAYLAWYDAAQDIDRQDFTWPAVINTDHIGLNTLLSQQVAENHQHLFGSSQTFGLSWCHIMNDARVHRKLDVGEKGSFENLLEPAVLADSTHKLLSMKECATYASRYRLELFDWIMGIKTGSDSWTNEIEPAMGLQESIQWHRQDYGAQVPQQDGSSAQLDYALTYSLFNYAPNAAYRALAGERCLLYRCFRRLFQGALLDDEADIPLKLCLYLQLKALIRSEIIQTNGMTGFRNFQKYQDRKMLLCNTPYYQAELIRMGIAAPMLEGTVVSLETRITPKDTAKENRDFVATIDRYAQYSWYNQTEVPFPMPATDPKDPKASSWHYGLQPYFYVFHFIKGPDPLPKDVHELVIACRHEAKRKEIKKQAVALAQALSIYPNFSRRIRGIDAASSEIGCPPEVFAQAYRFLRNFSAKTYAIPSILHPPSMPRLGLTYHAGEDFLDIASGLRSIDEAVTLLKLQRGDRIGHALCLGIEPTAYYDGKHQHILVTKQDRLDDLVWLLFRSRELDVRIDHMLFRRLLDEAEQLLQDLYGSLLQEAHNLDLGMQIARLRQTSLQEDAERLLKNLGSPMVQNRGMFVTLAQYHNAMKLRGDNPYCYVSGEKFEAPQALMDHYESFAWEKSIELDEYRQSETIVHLIHLYHFSAEVKHKGNAVFPVKIDEEYIHLMWEMQERMQHNLHQRGIVVECNPSSNVQVGTFRSYQQHPMFRFYNHGLKPDEKTDCGAKQMHICINTDDLGVFDTSQEFEYAMVFDALKQCLDDKGHQVYCEADILRYLEEIRQMGFQAVFPNNEVRQQRRKQRMLTNYNHATTDTRTPP